MLVPVYISLFLSCFISCCTCVLLSVRPYRGAILAAHNYYRRIERASDMNGLTWDSGLERRAARWVSGCYFEHQRRGLGENLSYFTTSGPTIPPRTVVQRSLGLWAAEKSLYRWGPSCGAACHYTQLIWARTRRVGCALSYCPVIQIGFGSRQRNAMYFACFYYPPGNFIGRYPFTPGRRCSRCGRGRACRRGLCSGRFRGRRRRSVKQTPKEEFLGIVKERTDGF